MTVLRPPVAATLRCAAAVARTRGGPLAPSGERRRPVAVRRTRALFGKGLE